ncbi:MAG: hypothetical protein K6F57_00235 [Candidatus Saccharibacteria bacterium]|nr:hypothetical protein [Candidatus Saccharibacteria bacterium]
MLTNFIFSHFYLIISIIGLGIAIPGYIRAKNLSKKLILTHDERTNIAIAADDGSTVEINYINRYNYWLDEFGIEIRDAKDPFSRTRVEIKCTKGDKVLYRISRNIKVDSNS